MIKNRHYWHRGVHGGSINEYFSTKNIGGLGFPSGKWYETEFNIFVLKEPDHNIIIMSTFSSLTMSEGQKEEISIANEEVVKLKYHKVVAGH